MPTKRKSALDDAAIGTRARKLEENREKPFRNAARSQLRQDKALHELAKRVEASRPFNKLLKVATKMATKNVKAVKKRVAVAKKGAAKLREVTKKVATKEVAKLKKRVSKATKG